MCKNLKKKFRRARSQFRFIAKQLKKFNIQLSMTSVLDLRSSDPIINVKIDAGKEIEFYNWFRFSQIEDGQIFLEWVKEFAQKALNKREERETELEKQARDFLIKYCPALGVLESMLSIPFSLY